MRKSRMCCAFAALAVLAVAANANADSVTGQITEVGKDFLVVKQKDQSKKIRVLSDTQITLDGKKAALTQLKKGQKAAVTFKKNGDNFDAQKIVATSANASLVPVVLLDDKDKALTYSGMIKAINKTTLSVMKRDAKKAYDFQIASDTVIKVNGKTGSLKDLKVGQTVTVSYVKKDGKLHAKTITAKSA